MKGRVTVIAVDIGTSAVRAALFSQKGDLIRLIRQERSSAVGGEQFDASSLWADVSHALWRLNAEDERVVALAISAHIGTIAVDESLTPVIPAGGWADSRGVSALEEYGSDIILELLDASGRPAVTGGALAVALELQRLGVENRVSKLLSPKDFIVAKLTGVEATDTINAAYSLASNIKLKCWQIEVLDKLTVPPEWFPPQRDPFDVIGEIGDDAADRCRLPAGIPVVACGPDGSIGLGLLLGCREDSIANVAGTTDVIGTLIREGELTPSEAVVNPSLRRRRWTAGGSTGLTGGAVANWRLLVGAVEEDILSAVEPGSGGLSIIPTMSGERFPRWRPMTRGSIVGRTADHDASYILRAAQEGAAFTVREGLDALDASKQKEIVVAGGSVRSRSVAQLRANIFGRVIRVADNPDVTLLGAAGLALIGTGQVDDFEEVQELMGLGFTEFEPEESAVSAYSRIYDSWRRVREILAKCDEALVHESGVTASGQH